MENEMMACTNQKVLLCHILYYLDQALVLWTKTTLEQNGAVCFAHYLPTLIKEPAALVRIDVTKLFVH